MKIIDALFEYHMSFSEKLQFTKFLAVLLKSGVSLSEALDLLERQSKKKDFQAIIQKIKMDIANGLSLHKALERYPNNFNKLYVNLVRIGEESGTLENNLDYLALHLRKTYEFNKKVQGALLYPEIVLGLAFIISIGLSIFVLPKLDDLFSSLDIALPASTQALLFVSRMMKNYGFQIIFGFIFIVFGFSRLVKLDQIKPFWHAFLLRIPMLGRFLQDIEVASLCRNIGVMLESGLPLSAALLVQEDATQNVVFKKYIGVLKKGVEKGSSFREIFESASFAFFPMLASKMIGVGEKTGRLDESLVYLGEYYDGEVDLAAKNFSTIIDPIILIAVGVIVAFIAISIISPIYQFTGSIQR